jgi:predicted RNase H-like HicB family nuclease
MNMAARNPHPTQARTILNYTARYAKIESGYMGQLVDWPDVISEGPTLDECRTSLRDALREMIEACRQVGREVPAGGGLLEQVPVEI